MASTITLDGQLTDWTNIDRLDFGMTGLNGSKVYGRFVDGTYHFAIESSTVSIGADSTMWLNTDKNTATGYSFWDLAIGADYKVEFEADGLGGLRASLYSLDATGASFLVDSGVSFARSADGKFVELAIEKAKIGNSTCVSTLIDLNVGSEQGPDDVFLPGAYSQAPFTLTDQPPPVRADTNLKVAIVFSETSAAKYFSGTAYSQLVMAAQSQAIAAGVPFDILKEADLKDLSTVVKYDAIIFPSFANVKQSDLNAIEGVLTDAVYKYGISLVAAGNFMTNDESGVALPGDAYARMKTLLGVERVGGGNVDQIVVTGAGGASADVIGYSEGEKIRGYSENDTSQIGTSYFDGVAGGSTQVVATQATTSDGTKNAVLATQTGGNNVFFATESMLADSNMLQHAISWAARPENVPELKLQMGRQASIFAARNDMDQSQEIDNVNGGIYTSMLSIVEKWKTDFNFVGSYYVNVGNDAANGQTTDWAKSKPIYDQLLAMGNEIGTHSYTHPEDTNLLTPAQIQFEFQQSKLLLEQKLGITIQGAAVPGAPETLATSELIGQYFSYMTGGYTGVGAGYPGAFGYITPDSDSVYLAPNMKFDFSMVDAAPEYGGGLNAEQAKQEWIKEFNELSMKSDMPVFVWPWHDYGPTQWVINDGQPSRYTEAMYTDFLRYAYEQDTEFVTMLDLAQRIKAFEKAGFNYSFNSATNTMTATVTADVTANQIGTFALDVEKGKTIASVSGWYAYDHDSVFMDADGGTYTIKLGTPEDVTHITALPSRAQLLSVTGDGLNLNFSIKGDGKIAIDLANPEGRQLVVTGAEITKLVGDKLELKVTGSGTHTISVNLDQLAKPVVALKEDTGSSLSDNISSKGELSVAGIAVGATVEYSLDGNTWTGSFTPIEGANTVLVRQKAASGVLSEVSSLAFTLDSVAPTSTVDMPKLNASGMSTVTITFDEVPDGFVPETDLEVVGGSLTDVTVDGTGKVYTGTFKAFANFEGLASVALKANSYTDKAGNAGQANAATLGVDTKAPTVTSINLSQTLLRAGETALVTIVFSEKVNGITADSVTADNGTLSALTSSDGGKTWTGVFTPTQDIEDTTNIVRVTSNYTDLAGNAGSGSDSVNYAIDTKAPTASIVLPPLDGAGESTVTITFSEIPQGFDPGTDLDVVGGTLTGLTPDAGGTVYTGTFKAFANQDGVASITLKAGSYTDTVGNAGAVGVATLGIDTKAPTVTSIGLSKTSLRAGETADVTIVFAEEVQGFDNSDVTVENGTLSALATSDGGKTWKAVFTPTHDIEDPTNIVRVTGDYTDLVNNAGNGSDSGNYGVDTKAPTASISLPAFDGNGESTVTITFSEKPEGFDPEADLEVVGGTFMGLAPDLAVDSTGKTYKGAFKAFASYDGAARIALKAGSYTDAAGNAGQASSVTLGVDTRAPKVASINLSKSFLRAGEKAAVTIVFSEIVDEFDNSDVIADNGTLSALTSSDGGKTWTGVFTPTQDIEDTTNIVRVTSNYTDLAGNAGSGSDSANYAIDTKGPTVSITQAKLGSGNAILATFTFSEAVDPSTFTAQDVIVTGAKLESLAHQGGTTYMAILTPLMSGGGQVSIGVNNATYADVAGNAGTGAFKAFGATQAKATSGADWLVGTSGKNTLKGGGGDDIIRGGKGNDTISGDGGKDLLDFSDGTKGIKITLSQENTKYATFDGRAAGLGIDKYRDMEGVIGTKFADTITGSSSGDVLAGLGGNDILRGGRGNDVFVFESNGGRDKIMDFEDTGSRHDKLDVSYFDFNVTSNAFAAWKADHVKQQGAHTIVSFDASTSVTLTNIKVKAIGFDDFLF